MRHVFCPPSPVSNIGMPVSARRTRTASYAIMNGRPYMEDRHNIRLNLVPGVHLLAVYDGHGGAEVAAKCADVLPGILRRRLLRGASADGAPPPWTEWGKIMRAGVREADRKCEAPFSARGVGSTLCMALFSLLDNKVVTANLGDSRMVLLRDGRRDAVQLTRDHNLHCPKERRRITRAGGVVLRDMFGTDRVMGVLNLTRSMGDWYLRPYVSATPVVSVHDLRPGDELLVASDGLWDVVPTAQLPTLLAQEGAPGSTAPRRLAREAVRLGSLDNITVAWVRAMT